MDADSPNQIVRFNDVCYRYPGDEQLELRVPRFGINTNEHTAITGPSGCGKTTLLRLLSGVLMPTHGVVETLGVDTASQSNSERGQQRIRSIGMVFQDFALIEYLSALDNILLTARLGKLDLSSARDLSRELADRAGIGHVLRRFPHQLSQGERQRVAICRSLVTKPKLIVCDEPTGNLDPSRSMDIIDLIHSEAQSIGATIVAVTHNQSVCDRFDRSIDLSDFASLEGGGS
ncbi:MAG: ABC transporter ATP-binding protein [Phycisphaerales bacterium]|nr:ABC transporter ATP-binding protein [Phycisphaerales bacterium]